MEKTIQELESTDDLGALVQGDVVNLRIKCSGFMDRDYTAAFHCQNHRGQLEFLVPRCIKEEYIVMNRAYLRDISVENGGIHLREERSAAEAFSQGNPDYAKLNKTLQIAGLR